MRYSAPPPAGVCLALIWLAHRRLRADPGTLRTRPLKSRRQPQLRAAPAPAAARWPLRKTRHGQTGSSQTAVACKDAFEAMCREAPNCAWVADAKNADGTAAAPHCQKKGASAASPPRPPLEQRRNVRRRLRSRMPRNAGLHLDRPRQEQGWLGSQAPLREKGRASRRAETAVAAKPAEAAPAKPGQPIQPLPKRQQLSRRRRRRLRPPPRRRCPQLQRGGACEEK